MVLRALRDAGKYLDQGHLVCIFAEGQVTRTGMMLPFRRGFQRIVKGRTTPIIPIHLDRVFGSIFSRQGGRVLFKLPKQLPFPVGVSYGKPLEAGASVAEVRRAVHELGAEAWALNQAGRPHCTTASFADGGVRFALLWPTGSVPVFRGFKALTGAIALARALRPRWDGQDSSASCCRRALPARWLTLRPQCPDG